MPHNSVAPQETNQGTLKLRSVCSATGITVLLTAKTDWKMFCVLAIRYFVTSFISAGLNASLPTPIIKQVPQEHNYCGSDYSKH